MAHAVEREQAGRPATDRDDIAAADIVLIAADTTINTSRFTGKRIYETSTKNAINDGAAVVRAALEQAAVQDGAGAEGTKDLADQALAAKAAQSAARTGVYKHLMTGVSYMIPFVVAGGLLIALAFVPLLWALDRSRTNRCAIDATTIVADLQHYFRTFTPHRDADAAFIDLAGLTAGIRRLQAMRHCILTDTSLNDGVTISSGFSTTLRTNHTTSTTHVFNDHGLVQDLGELWRHHATHHVTGTTRWERHDDFDRLTWIVLR